MLETLATLVGALKIKMPRMERGILLSEPTRLHRTQPGRDREEARGKGGKTVTQEGAPEVYPTEVDSQTLYTALPCTVL